MDESARAQQSAHDVRCGRDVAVPPHLLADDLERLRADGYDAAEFAMQTLHCVLGGRLHERHTTQVAAICAQHAGALAYSVHSPAVLDLRDRADPDLHRQILVSCVRFSAAIGARVLVVHFEERSDDAVVEARFRAAIEEAADLAGAHKLILSIENIEVERTERVLEFLEAVRHPWVRMTYDFAHDYLASGHFGYDHLASARACVPYAAHLHLTDNFGRFNPARLGDFNLYRAIPPANTYVTGLGDLHLPLGWGTLPAAEIFAGFAAAGYHGLLISEHDRRSFPSEDATVRASMQALLR